MALDPILTKAVQIMRNEDNYQKGRDVNAVLIPTGSSSDQLYIPTLGCRFACVMCNYGFLHGVRELEILKEVDKICNHLLADGERNVILESSGSFLDEAEISKDLQEKIMRRVAMAKVPRIAIETHYTTVTDEKIEMFKKMCPLQEKEFELGLESTNQEVLKIYNKSIELNGLLETIWRAYRNGIEVSLNLLVGAPLLTIKEQIQDTVDSINWVLENCPQNTSMVLFPLNVKDYTLVKHMYNQGRYSIISHWEFIEVISSIPPEALDRVYLSWWGNRCNEFHGPKAIIKPRYCSKCKNGLETFYKHFVRCIDAVQKKQLIDKISAFNCQCKNDFVNLKESQKTPKLSYGERLDREKARLKQELHL